MKSPVYAIAVALLLARCGGDPCSDIENPEQALGSTCGATNDTPPPSTSGTTCTPRAGTICTVIGSGEAGIGTENVSGLRTRTYLPQDMTVSADGRRLYFLDWNNHTIRELTPEGIVRTIAGTGELQDGDDPPVMMGAPRVPVPALRHRLNHPTHMTLDSQGRLLVAAWHNSMIKRVTNVGQPSSMIEDLCGTGGRSFAGDGGPALMAVLDLPVAVAIHPQSSEIYIADQANQRIRRVNGMGVISTVLGTGMAGYSGDGGPALMAQIRNPVGQAAPPAGRIEFDQQGNLYIADTGNNVIRRMGADGVVRTFAGNGMAGFSGDGSAATSASLNAPADIEIGPDGTVYIADTGNNCVRAVGSNGNIRTVVGRCGMRGFAGDGADPTQALLDRPYGVESDTQGRLWVADTYNQRIRVVMAGTAPAR